MLAWMAVIALGEAPDPVVRVVVGSAACAGAIVGPGRVLTAYHCVATGGGARLITRDGRSVRGRVRAWDVAADLAVLDAPDLTTPPFLEIADRSPAPGAPIDVVGHPYGGQLPSGYYEGLLRWSVSSGVVSGVGERALQFDAPVNPGNSGGPVLDADGRIVSVVSRRLGGGGLGFGARTERVARVVSATGRRPGLGGALQLGVALATLGAADGGASVGPWAEASVRDRVFVGGGGALPIAPALSAARFGSASFAIGAGYVGLRQRVGNGPWCTRFDLLGGLSAVGRWTGAVEGDRLAIRSETSAPWHGGGAISARGVRFGLAWTSEESLLASVGIAWPGTVAVW